MTEIRIAAAYIRVSTDDQVEYSPDAQLRELREYASAHCMILANEHVYKDEGISGRKAEKRPGFMAMIDAAKSKPRPFDIILVHKFDRFARSREDSIVYKSILKKAGVEVISIKEPISEGSYAGVMEAIYESFAEAYSLNLGQEVRKGMKEKALRGEWQTTPPYGYALINKQLVPHEMEAEYVREIFRRFASGEPYLRIARWLNSVGQRTKRGNTIEGRTIEYIIHNPVYIGKVRWTPVGRTDRDYANPNAIIAQGSHTPLIDQALWDAAQSRAAELKRIYSRHHQPSGRRRHWLVGILRCADCGATLATVYGDYMRCNNYLKGRCNHSQNVPIDAISKAVISALQRDLSAETINVRYTVSTASPVSNTAEKDLAQLKKKKERLTAAYLDGVIALPEFKSLSAALDAELSAAQASLPAAEVSSDKENAAQLRRRIEKTLQILLSPDADINQMHDSLASIVEKALWNASTRILTLHYHLTL